MPLEIQFLGAARTVTGSQYLISNGNEKILIDCGMFRGENKITSKNYNEFDFNPAEVSHVILTHAHIDHSGLIPKLVSRGFNGRIICTKPTVELCKIMLPDAAHVEQQEIEWKNRKRLRAGRELLKPVYTLEEAVKSLEYFSAFEYNRMVDLRNGFKVKLREAGHILGSSIVEVHCKNGAKNAVLIFSGDIGNESQEIVKDPAEIRKADYLFVESTYGDRLHKNRIATIKEFTNIIEEAQDMGGNIVIPAFAVERTQEIIYELSVLYYKKKLGAFRVYVDSPLAIAATEIFKDNLKYFDRETKRFMKENGKPFAFPTLEYIRRAEDSMKLNDIKSGAIIISASGMCEAGRIKHHLKHNLWRPECKIVFTGYQAMGTLGRAIVDGIKSVRIYGEDIAVKAKIHTLGGFSGHADQEGLHNWVSKIKTRRMKAFVIHGEEKSALAFAEHLREKLRLDAYAPMLGEKIVL